MRKEYHPIITSFRRLRESDADSRFLIIRKCFFKASSYNTRNLDHIINQFSSVAYTHVSILTFQLFQCKCCCLICFHRLVGAGRLLIKGFVVNGTAMTGVVATVIAFEAWIGTIRGFFYSNSIHFGPMDAVFVQDWSRNRWDFRWSRWK